MSWSGAVKASASDTHVIFQRGILLPAPSRREVIPTVNPHRPSATGVAAFRAGFVLLEQRRVAVLKVLQLHPRNFPVDRTADNSFLRSGFRRKPRASLRRVTSPPT